jgi:hypothetical protein
LQLGGVAGGLGGVNSRNYLMSVINQSIIKQDLKGFSPQKIQIFQVFKKICLVIN